MYKSIFISDIHLGSAHCQSQDFFNLLEKIESEKIFLIGDIINASTPQEHPDVIKFINLLESKPWEIIYIGGNHEEDRKKFPPVSLSFKEKLLPIKNYIYNNGKEQIYIEHGHKFHESNIINIILKKMAISLRFKGLNKNKKRVKKRDKKKSFYHKIMKPIAQKLLINSFRRYIIFTTQKNNCSIAIAGHFHLPEDKRIQNIRYLNCGDWVKNRSYITENQNSEFFLHTKSN
jgi:UDP-2,3-diacylglucosamine pyrophosphatase LpxH